VLKAAGFTRIILLECHFDWLLALEQAAEFSLELKRHAEKNA